MSISFFCRNLLKPAILFLLLVNISLFVATASKEKYPAKVGTDQVPVPIKILKHEVGPITADKAQLLGKEQSSPHNFFATRLPHPTRHQENEQNTVAVDVQPLDTEPGTFDEIYTSPAPEFVDWTTGDEFVFAEDPPLATADAETSGDEIVLAEDPPLATADPWTSGDELVFAEDPLLATADAGTSGDEIVVAEDPLPSDEESITHDEIVDAVDVPE